MSKRRRPAARPANTSISWDRVRAIFDYPAAPQTVWEKQFDYMDDALQRMANTPYDQIDFSDMWYYHHDLAYVELQPELFAYLFPVCLMDWHETLMRNVACSHGDSEFHYGLHQGNVLEKMLTDQQQLAVVEFFKDSFLLRLDSELQFCRVLNKAPTFYGWQSRFNSLGVVLPRIESIWNAWWLLETPGRAIAAIQYISGLMYADGENPLFEEICGLSPHLWHADCSIYHVGWQQSNREFLRDTLTLDFIHAKVQQALLVLEEPPELTLVQQLEANLPECRELMEIRIGELPQLLCEPNAEGFSL